jgi:hypothetical protein
MRLLKRAAALTIMAGVSVSVPAYAASKVISYPMAIQGIWMSDDAAGKSQCREYLAAFKENPDEASNFLVGAEIVSGNMWHSYSEYGEGNFYSLRALTKTGKQSWRASAGLGLDTLVAAPDSAPVIVTMRIEKRKLIALIEGTVGNASENGKASTYFRCRNVPRSLYGR